MIYPTRKAHTCRLLISRKIPATTEGLTKSGSSIKHEKVSRELAKSTSLSRKRKLLQRFTLNEIVKMWNQMMKERLTKAAKMKNMTPKLACWTWLRQSSLQTRFAFKSMMSRLVSQRNFKCHSISTSAPLARNVRMIRYWPILYRL